MSDEQDAPPARVGQAQEPKHYVMFAIMPDGSFAMDHTCPDETTLRALAHWGFFRIDAWLANQAMQKMMAKAKENRIITGMLDEPRRRGRERFTL